MVGRRAKIRGKSGTARDRTKERERDNGIMRETERRGWLQIGDNEEDGKIEREKRRFRERQRAMRDEIRGRENQNFEMKTREREATGAKRNSKISFR